MKKAFSIFHLKNVNSILKLIFATLFVLISLTSFEQRFSDYSGLKCQGLIPNDFLLSSEEKYKIDFQQDSTTADRNFFLNSRFAIDEILRGGKIVFNDPISKYIQAIAKILLKCDLKLYENLRFYTIKSNVPNAFSTDQGIIFFTTGLISRLNNEAELAFILGHEISHYIEKHVKSGYLFEQDLTDPFDENSSSTKNNLIEKLSSYSQNHELEADSMGVELFKCTDYDPYSALTALEIVTQSKTCFENLEFPFDYYDLDSVKIPRNLFHGYQLFNTNKEADIDRISSHPDFETRQLKLKNINADKKVGKQFIYSESDFFYVRTLARLESLSNHISDRRYAEALFAAYVLELEFPHHSFIALSKLKAYYGLVKYKNLKPTKFDTEIVVLSDNSFDNVDLLKAFLKNLSYEQLSTIALRQAIEIQKKFPNDSEISLYKDEIIKSVIFNANIDLSKFRTDSYNTFYSEKSDSIILDQSNTTYDYSSKLNKLSKSKFNFDEPNDSKRNVFDVSKKEEVLEEKKGLSYEVYDPGIDFHWFYLYDLIKDSDLLEELKAIKNNESQKEKTTSSTKKIIVVEPVYQNYSLDQGKKLIKSERLENKIEKYYHKNYDDIDLDIGVLGENTFADSSVNEFNYLSTLNQWFYEINLHDGLDIRPSNQSKIASITDYYNCDYFLFTGIFAYKDRHKLSNTHLAMFGSLWFTPIAIVDLIVVHNNFLQATVIYNGSTAKSEFSEIKHINLRGSRGTMHYYIYDLLKRIDDEVKF